MVPASFQSFFVASAGAGGALIGLLFVAISISPDRIFRDGHPEPTAVAASAFTALVNAFFVSLGALIPQISIGWFVAIMAGLGLSNSLNLGIRLFRRGAPRRWLTMLRRGLLVLLSLGIYGFQMYVGINLIKSPTITDWVWSVAFLMLGVYGLGLTRAWELLGAPRYTLLAWLSPMHDVNRDAESELDSTAAPAPVPPALPASSPARPAPATQDGDVPGGR
jgi:hypothetical protein